MSRKIMQFRYYGENNDKNYPKGLSQKALCNKNIFKDYGIVKQLGIQTLPGTKFRINTDKDYIQIGSTGIYELDLSDLIEIEAIQFDEDSINTISSSLAYLIIDILYDDLEGIE